MGDEAAARGALASMQDRIARGAHDALGIPTSATQSDIRGAFLELTKQFHPARFGRMATDVQKLANEVFLGIRAAHDVLKTTNTRTSTSPGMPAIRPTGSINATAQMPALARPTTVGMPPLRTPGPRTPTPAMGTPIMPRPGNRTPTPAMGTPILPNPVGNRTPTPASGTPVLPGNRPPTPSGTSALPRPGNRTPTPAMGTPALPRSATDKPAKNPTLPLPAVEDKRTSKPTTPGAAPSSPLPLSLPTPTSTAQTTDKSFPRIETQPGVSARSLRTDRLDHRLDPSTTKPPAPSVAVAIELLANKQWDAAKVALSALAAMAPDSQHVRALVFFASGRQAQLEHRLDEARIDLQRALQLDPDLAPAKAALGELFVRRK